MYARVAAFENADMSAMDELIADVGRRAEARSELPDARRVLLLLDRERGSSLGITFFETEEAIRAAEPVFERMGDEIPEEQRGKRTSVEIYEVVLEDVAEGARAARISTLEGSPERIDEGIAYIKENVVPAAGEMSGWRGLVALVDHASGRTKTITFWDGPESLRASEARADELRSEAAEALGETIMRVERYEVALDRVLAPTTA